MSNTIYPLGIINHQKVTPFNKVVADEFENGSTMTRLFWNAQHFKRKFEISHGALTPLEYRHLRSFYSQRSGGYDAFWFRDNVNRKGNASVRFASALPDDHDGVLFNVQISLEEIAATRALPEWDEVTNAAGQSPVLWYDANREFYLSHAGNLISEPNVYDSANQNYPASWQAGSLSLGGSNSQYQTYNFTGTNWAKTSASISELAGAQPACTLFAIAKQSGGSFPKQVLFSIGSMGTGAALGLALAADNRYEPWLGGSETWTNARQNNSSSDTYRSLALVWAGSSNNVTLYSNAASIGTDTVSRSLTAGPLSLGAAIDGTLKANSGGGMANNSLAHILVFPTALSLAQIKNVHNLLGYQYGLPTI
jgi:hypothetical protein